MSAPPLITAPPETSKKLLTPPADQNWWMLLAAFPIIAGALWLHAHVTVQVAPTTPQPPVISQPLKLADSPIATESWYGFQLTNILVHDGDTWHCDIHFPLCVTLTQERIRMNDCDAYETTRTRFGDATTAEELAKGAAATTAVSELLTKAKAVYFKPGTEKSQRDVYGRALGSVIIVKSDDTVVHFGKWLKEHGYQRPETSPASAKQLTY